MRLVREFGSELELLAAVFAVVEVPRLASRLALRMAAVGNSGKIEGFEVSDASAVGSSRVTRDVGVDELVVSASEVKREL